MRAQAAADAHLVAQAQVEQARSAAAAAADALEDAQDAVAGARAEVAELGRESYMRGQTLSGVAAILDSEGPADMMQRATTLDLLGVQRTTTLNQFEIARVRQANANSAARETLDRVGEAEQVAEKASAIADTRMRAADEAYEAAAARRSEYQRQLQQAQIQLLRLQGERDAYDAWNRQQQARAAAETARAAEAAREAAEAAEAARDAEEDTEQAPHEHPPGDSDRPSARGVAPTSGIFTTCYEMRWGVMHHGVDIAAPTGTPVYAPVAGRVVRAGVASGFGLAVYIQHDDGSVTVYGHINDYFVSAGQRVAAGQQIAEVGNRGQSTGPHLHFEVHADGMYQGRTNPIPWLASRGVSMGGPCR